MTCETPCSKPLQSMNDNETGQTAVSELVGVLDGIFPERSALTLENQALRDRFNRTSRLIHILKWTGMLPFALQVAVMIGQVISGLPLHNIDPLLLGLGLILLITVHFFETIFGRWRFDEDGRFAFIPVPSRE